MKLYIASLAFLAVPLIACSNSPLEPGAGSQAGTGTSTLFVEGNASAEPKTPNAHLSTDFTTDFSVRVQLNGQNVTTGATVTMESSSGVVTLTFNPDNNGRWVGTASNYDEVYRLDVVAGADKVEGVYVDGPDIHTMKSPTAGASLDSTMPNDILWDRGEAADVATLDVGHIERLTIADTGKYTLAASSLDANKDSTKENTIDIRRTNHITPAGAIGGSNFQVSIRNSVDVLALANPAL